MRDMKRHTSIQLKSAIKDHPSETRREWILWMMKRAGMKNCNNIEFQLWQQDNHPIQLDNPFYCLSEIGIYPLQFGRCRNCEKTRGLFIQQCQKLLWTERIDRGYTVRSVTDVKTVLNCSFQAQGPATYPCARQRGCHRLGMPYRYEFGVLSSESSKEFMCGSGMACLLMLRGITVRTCSHDCNRVL